MRETARAIIEDTDAPNDAPVDTLDVRNAGPPEPLRRTLELLPDLADDVVLVQRNDRAPQHLYPKLDDRGFAYETLERTDETITVVWKKS